MNTIGFPDNKKRQSTKDPAASFRALADTVLAGSSLSRAQMRFLAHTQADRLPLLLQQACRIKEHFFQNKISLCAILNARSGACGEDCAFCAQSSHHQTSVAAHEFVSPETIQQAAHNMAQAGASRFSLVTSGKQLAAKDFTRLLQAVACIKRAGLLPDASVGILSKAQLEQLKAAGLAGYHHNLETARSYFPSICSTHDYEEDVATVRDAVAAGLYVCSGGIFGLGESWEHRIELALELKSLEVPSVPVNFLHPIPGTPMATRPVLSQQEALTIIALLRFILPDRHIRICGGRPVVFAQQDRHRVLLAGASGLMIGDYLTVQGASLQADSRDIQRLGMKKE